MGKTDSKYKPLISICIPTYREEKYIVDTVKRLKAQNIADLCEVVICDYDPDNIPLYNRPITKLLKYPFVRFIDAGRKGIGYARHMAIMASSGRYVVNFDADGHFRERNAIQLLLDPIYRQKVLITSCPNILSEQEISDQSIPYKLYEIRNWLEYNRLLPSIFEAGLTFSKQTYDLVGGFRDVQSCEAPLFALDAALRLGYDKIKVIDNVHFVSSARRAHDLFKFLELNYHKAYRGDQELNVI